MSDAAEMPSSIAAARCEAFMATSAAARPPQSNNMPLLVLASSSWSQSFMLLRFLLERAVAIADYFHIVPQFG
jgi:hypothetical protein